MQTPQTGLAEPTHQPYFAHNVARGDFGGSDGRGRPGADPARGLPGGGTARRGRAGRAARREPHPRPRGAGQARRRGPRRDRPEPGRPGAELDGRRAGGRVRPADRARTPAHRARRAPGRRLRRRRARGARRSNVGRRRAGPRPGPRRDRAAQPGVPRPPRRPRRPARDGERALRRDPRPHRAAQLPHLRRGVAAAQPRPPRRDRRRRPGGRPGLGPGRDDGPHPQRPDRDGPGGRRTGGNVTYRLGVDVGRTFTDVLLVEEASGATWRAKTASTPSDQAVGVRNGIAKVCEEAGIALSEVAQVLHGTTVATNAILEGKGATVGLVTTKGFRQVLQIARSYVPGGLAGWIIWPKPEPLAALENTVEVDERLASDGAVIRELDEADVRAQLGKLTGHGIQALAVSLINSFADPAHERRIREIAAEVLPGVPVSLSSDVLPELREYERTITTVANGYVQPQVKRYVETLAAGLRESGVAGELAILRS